jgi:hypothetical protein
MGVVLRGYEMIVTSINIILIAENYVLALKSIDFID